MRDLIKNPIWKKSELGLPIPDSQHAVSVALPEWNDVIDYEEKKPECINSLKSIYPRFGINPLLKKLSNELLKQNNLQDHNAWPYSSRNLVLKAKIYCDKFTDQSNSFIKESQSLFFLITKDEANNYAKVFWQHTGLGASSREAAINLKLEPRAENDLAKDSERKIINRISKYVQSNSELIHITSSGMSALYSALEIIYKIFPKKPTLQIGFPYVDVLKLPKNIFYGANLIIEDDLQKIEFEIKRIDPAAIIIELPSNPLLKCTNIIEISKIAKKYNIPLITDDTIGSNLNINSLNYSDIVFTSLTKIFSGSGDILAGSLIFNPKSKWIDKFKKALNEIDIPKLSDNDLVSLEKCSRDIEFRVINQNSNCLKLKKKLENHHAVKTVFHPENCPNFNSILKRDGGYGCLLSFELKGNIEKTKKFYNALELSKGPSLGTQFSLICPYVLLAHYNELEWANSCGVPSNLIRVSVGLEDHNHIWNVFLKAFNT